MAGKSTCTPWPGIQANLALVKKGTVHLLLTTIVSLFNLCLDLIEAYFLVSV